MVPPKSDPRWTAFIDNLGSVPVTSLSARMLMSRLKMKLGTDKSPDARVQAIADAHDFFAQNESIVHDDIKKIFG